MPAFIKRQQLLSTDQYEIVDVRTLRGVRRAMLFPKAILQGEFAANREVLASKRERWRAKRESAASKLTCDPLPDRLYRMAMKSERVRSYPAR